MCGSKESESQGHDINNLVCILTVCGVCVCVLISIPPVCNWLYVFIMAKPRHFHPRMLFLRILTFHVNMITMARQSRIFFLHT